MWFIGKVRWLIDSNRTWEQENTGRKIEWRGKPFGSSEYSRLMLSNRCRRKENEVFLVKFWALLSCNFQIRSSTSILVQLTKWKKWKKWKSSYFGAKVEPYYCSPLASDTIKHFYEYTYTLLPYDRPYTSRININDITSLAFQIWLFVNDATAEVVLSM